MKYKLTDAILTFFLLITLIPPINTTNVTELVWILYGSFFRDLLYHISGR